MTDNRPLGIMLVNLGTPDSTDTPDVRRYLREFLNDPRVIDINPIGKWLLLNLIILPFRPAKSGEAYKTIWTERGSPLLFHGQDLAAGVQEELGEEFEVVLAMRYGNPSVKAGLETLLEKDVRRIVVLPLFPQYSSAAFGSAVEKVMHEAGKLWDVPPIDFMRDFYAHPEFIESVAVLTEEKMKAFNSDYLLMSYHGIPERHVAKSDQGRVPDCNLRDRCPEVGHGNRYCYRAQCYATSDALAERLNLSPDQYMVAYQSRLGRTPWIHPYTDEVVVELAKKGVKRLSVVCPSFVADCLETIEEIGDRAKEDFIEAGGEDLQLIPCVNSTPRWVQGVSKIIREHLGQADQAPLKVLNSNVA